MSTSEKIAGHTPQIEPIRTTEQLVMAPTLAHEIGYRRRLARRHGNELRGLGLVAASRLLKAPLAGCPRSHGSLSGHGPRSSLHRAAGSTGA